MTGALVLLAFLGHTDSVRVRGVARDTTLAVEVTASGDALRADVVLPLLGGVARVTGFGRWTIELQGTSVGLVDGAPFATSRGVAIPLAAAPCQQHDALFLPLQLLAELFPRLGGSITWDAGRRELRVARLAVTAVSSPRAVTAVSWPPRSSPAAPTTPASPALPTSLSSPGASTTSSRAVAPHQWTVVVDAGHGGVDPGMHGSLGNGASINEKDVTLGVAKRLSRELEARGVAVVMTRATDTLIALSDRGRIANQHQGNLFISIHVNAANPNWKNPQSARGFETYFLAEARTEDDRRVAQMENEVVRFEAGTEQRRDDALGFILSDMMQNEHLRESNDLAEYVQAQLAKIHPGPSRGVKQAGFVVLVTSFMPSVLVEIGFGTNPAEAAWIAGDAGQRTIANAVANAAVEYLAHYERRVGGMGGTTGVGGTPRR